MAPELTGQQDFRTYARILWRWKFLFAAFVVLIPLIAYLIESGKQKIYQSSTLIELQDVSASSLGTTGGPVASGNLDAVARLVTTTPVVEIAAGLLHLPPRVLASEISAEEDNSTGFITITARDPDPTRAAAIANAFAAALSRHQVAQANRIVDEQIRGLERQRQASPHSDLGGRVSLSQQILQLQAVKGSTRSAAAVIQAARPSGTPVAPNPRGTVELALVIALLLGAGAVFLAENADRRLRTPDSIEGLTGWPLLAAIPPTAFDPARLEEPRNEEAFSMLDTALAYFNVERSLGSVAIVSPQVSAGKTTVAVGLAVAVAHAGQRAILIDADLRRPQVCARLGVQERAGLGAVLAGKKSAEEAMFEYPVESPDGGRLLVLGAGPPPPNPVALLRSQKMRALITELEREADLVIVDTVAALAVSDALPLLGAVSGIVLVVRMNRTSRAALRRQQKMITSAHGTVLGAVATGSGAVAPGYGVYPYAYDGHARGGIHLLHRNRRRAAPIDNDGISANGARPLADGADARGPDRAHPDGGDGARADGEISAPATKPHA